VEESETKWGEVVKSAELVSLSGSEPRQLIRDGMSGQVNAYVYG